MDLLWSSLRRGWVNKMSSSKSFKGATYCTAYHRLVTGEQEVFCDELTYQLGYDDGGDRSSKCCINEECSDDLPTPDSGTYCPSISEDTAENDHDYDHHHHDLPGEVQSDFQVQTHRGHPDSPSFERKIKKSTSLQFPRKLKMSISRSLNFSIFQSSIKDDIEELEDEIDDDYDDDYDWDDESLTCNVCDRSFDSPRQLERHQLRKRHWGCSECDTLFNSQMDLEHHKEAFNIGQKMMKMMMRMIVILIMITIMMD